MLKQLLWPLCYRHLHDHARSEQIWLAVSNKAILASTVDLGRFQLRVGSSADVMWPEYGLPSAVLLMAGMWGLSSGRFQCELSGPNVLLGARADCVYSLADDYKGCFI